MGWSSDFNKPANVDLTRACAQCSLLPAVFNHRFHFHSLLEMFKLVGFHPPPRPQKAAQGCHSCF